MAARILLMACTALCLFAVSALSQGADSVRSTIEELPSAAPFDEAKVVEQRFREWADLEVKGDLNAWSQFVAEDAVLQPPGEPEVRGLAAIRDYAAKFFELPIVGMEPGELTVVVSESGDLAYNAGNLKMTLDNPQGILELDLKSTAIWRKIDGSWKIILNSWSSNTP